MRETITSIGCIGEPDYTWSILVFMVKYIALVLISPTAHLKCSELDFSAIGWGPEVYQNWEVLDRSWTEIKNRSSKASVLPSFESFPGRMISSQLEGHTFRSPYRIKVQDGAGMSHNVHGQHQLHSKRIKLKLNQTVGYLFGTSFSYCMKNDEKYWKMVGCVNELVGLDWNWHSHTTLAPLVATLDVEYSLSEQMNGIDSQQAGNITTTLKHLATKIAD